jgi:hypothetical protein
MRRKKNQYEEDLLRDADDYVENELVDYTQLFSAHNWEDAKTSARVGGNKKAIDTAERLWQLACRYFEYTEANLAKKHDFIKSGPFAGKTIVTYHPRPFSWVNFEAFLWIKGYVSNLNNYRHNVGGRYTEFIEVIRAIGNVIKGQKFDGAAVGIFNSSIILKDLYPSETKGNRGEGQPATQGPPTYTAPVINVYYDGAPPLAGSENEVDTRRAPRQEDEGPKAYESSEPEFDTNVDGL